MVNLDRLIAYDVIFLELQLGITLKHEVKIHITETFLYSII